MGYWATVLFMEHYSLAVFLDIALRGYFIKQVIKQSQKNVRSAGSKLCING